jgi:glycine hydroxymethyltransferase
MHIIAAKAVVLGEALRPDFTAYAQQVVDNAACPCLVAHRARPQRSVSGGTGQPRHLVDLRPKKATGYRPEKVLDRAGITVNKNSIPGDPEKFTVTSACVWGSPAGTHPRPSASPSSGRSAI